MGWHKHQSLQEKTVTFNDKKFKFGEKMTKLFAAGKSVRIPENYWSSAGVGAKLQQGNMGKRKEKSGDAT